MKKTLIKYITIAGLSFYLGAVNSKKENSYISTKNDEKYLIYNNQEFKIRENKSIQFGTIEYRVKGLMEESNEELKTAIENVRKKIQESNLALINPGND